MRKGHNKQIAANPSKAHSGQWKVTVSRIREVPYAVTLDSIMNMSGEPLCMTRTLPAALRLADMLNEQSGFPALTAEQRDVKQRIRNKA